MNLSSQTDKQSSVTRNYYGFFLWVIVAVFYGLDYLQHTLPSVLIGPLSHSVDLSFVRLADIMSVYFPIYAISQIPAGYLIDRFGLGRTLTSACLLASVGLLVMLMPFIWTILLGRILIAMGSAFAFIGALKAASIWLPASIFPIMVGVINSIGVIGGMLGQVLINHLIGEYGWQYALLSVALFSFLWSVVIFTFIRSTQKNINIRMPPLIKLSDIIVVIQNKNLWFISVYAAIMVGVVMSTFSELYDVKFLESIYHLSSQHAAWLASLIFIGVGVGGPIHGLIARLFKHQRSWMLLACAATIIVFSLIPIMAIYTHDISVIAVIYFALGFFVSSMLLAFSQARRLYPQSSHGVVFSFVNMMIGLGGFVFPIIFGALITVAHGFFPAMNQLILAMCGLALFLLLSLLFALKMKFTTQSFVC